MVSPLADQWPATTGIAAQLPSAPPELLPAEVRRAGRVAAWFDRWL